MNRGAVVYIAFTCKSEFESGDYRYSYFHKDKFDEEMLGVFFSLEQANKCARNYTTEEFGVNLDDDDFDQENDIFEFDSCDSDCGDGHNCNYYNKVWVECKPIEDASRRFHI